MWRLEGRAEPVGAPGKQGSGETEGGGGEHDFSEEQEIRPRPGGCDGDVVVGVADAPCTASPVRHQRGDETRDERIVLHAADDEHFEREHGPGDGRAENRAESRGHAGHEQQSDAGGIEFQNPGEGGRDAAAHLHGGALAPGRAAEEVGDQRA